MMVQTPRWFRPLLLAGCLGLPTTELRPQQPATEAWRALDADFAATRTPAAEARWTLVPWRKSLTAALAESRRSGKPVYLFVNDGEVETGFC